MFVNFDLSKSDEQLIISSKDLIFSVLVFLISFVNTMPDFDQLYNSYVGSKSTKPVL